MKSRLSMLIPVVLILTILSPALVKDVEAETQLSESGIFDSLTEKTSQNGLGLFDFLKAESVINLKYDDSSVKDPLIPGEKYIVPIYINYKIEGLLAEFYSTVLSDKVATIDLSVEKNEYCDLSISPASVETNITVEGTKISSKVSVVVNDDAVAKNEFKITVKAKSREIKGLLGIFTSVKESENATMKIPITPEYVPNIEVESDFDFKEIPPFNITEIPVNITNKGNGKTKVTMEAINVTQHFNVTLNSPIILDIDEKKQVMIYVVPDNDFNEQTLKINFTPSYHEDPSLTGDSKILTFTLKNDGSYKEKEDVLEIDFSIVIILAFAVLILVVFIFIIRKRF